MVLFWVLSAGLGFYSLAVTIRSNFTTGTLFLWLFTAALCIYGLFHRQINAFGRTGPGRVVLWCFIAACVAFVALFVFVAANGYKQYPPGIPTAIIVLGAGLNGENVSDVLARRLHAALALWRQYPDTVLVATGGQGRGEIIPEAHAMQRWLQAHGVPGEKIIAEDKSTSTEENLSFALPLLQQAGIGSDARVAVVSNAFHCYRAAHYAKLAGFTQAATLPASMNAFYLVPTYIREMAAIVYMWIRKK